jgi:hypothetical protein
MRCRIALTHQHGEAAVAWQHINLQGRFEFLKTPNILNVDAIIQRLTSHQAGRVIDFVA